MFNPPVGTDHLRNILIDFLKTSIIENQRIFLILFTRLPRTKVFVFTMKCKYRQCLFEKKRTEHSCLTIDAPTAGLIFMDIILPIYTIKYNLCNKSVLVQNFITCMKFFKDKSISPPTVIFLAFCALTIIIPTANSKSKSDSSCQLIS